MPGLDAAMVMALAALVTAGVSYRVSRSTQRKADADVAAIATQTALSLIEPLRKQVAALEEEVAALRARVASFRRGVRLLCGQVRDLGAVPVWLPGEEDAEE
jgi:uncharacterized protein YlxW (UPF0749 family)